MRKIAQDRLQTGSGQKSGTIPHLSTMTCNMTEIKAPICVGNP